MSILQRIRERAAADPQHIVLPEGEDPRAAVAAALVARERIARVTVLGDEEKVRAHARAAGADLGGVAVLDHTKAPDFERVAALYHELRRAKGMMPDEARIAVRDPLYYGNLLVRLGQADGSVAGATNTTAHTVRARGARGLANLLLRAEDGDAREPFARADRGGDDRARVFALGEDDVLRVGRGALADAFENVHKRVSGPLSVVSCSGRSTCRS